MWLIGAVLGLIIGSSIHHQIALLGAIVGGLLGWWISQRNQPVQPPELGVLDRLNRVEAQVAALQEELRLLKYPGQPKHTAVEAAPPSNWAIGPEIAEAPPPTFTRAETQDQAFAAEPLPEPSPAIEMPAWLKRLWEGNPLAKVGIILLFFGIASGLKLAAEYGLMPIPLRLFIAAALGIGLIVFGVTKVRDPEKPEHRTFGLAIQGGGFALLYLVGYFMLARYVMIGEGMAFGLFALVGVVCVLMAARQDGPALAVLGLSGAFLAPVLAGGRADSPLGLFSYFALLNAFILGVDWFKSWRVLNAAGFIFTLAVGMAWAMDGYQARHYLVTQSFLLLFLVAYSAMPVATALLRAPGLQGWQDGMLLFGTPLIGAFLQTRLMEGTEYGLAWSALLGSLWYFALWALLIRRSEPEIRLIERSHLGIAIALLTVSVPLAFGAQVTSAFWAAEGTAVLWFGVRTKRLLAQGTGLAMQFAAGVALVLGWHHLGHSLPVANDAMLGAVILTLTGLISARLLRLLESDIRLHPAIPFVWAMAWWLGAGLGEIERFALAAHHAPYGLLFVTATVVSLDGLSRLWRWPQARASTILLLIGMWAAAILTIDRSGHPLAGLMVLALPVAIALHYLLLATHEKSQDAPMVQLRHLGAWWLILVLLPLELSWQGDRMAPGVSLWPFMAWGIVLACGIALPVLGKDRFWPFASAAARYVPVGGALPAVALTLLLAWGNTHLTGATGSLALSYLPVLNFFDITALAGLGALLVLARALNMDYRRAANGIVLALGFLWLSTLAGRIAHHWGGIPFEFVAMMRATLFQAILTLFWTVTAIATMILGSRRTHREIWFGGFGLLGIVGAKLLLFDATGRGTLTWTGTLIGVALLVLAASYFAPMPPKAAQK
ncbi:MAG: DUF2339 domain-containing protein [Rhodocyclaceae bacterium]|nr:DUF2339 domain-containing protein [Rhodocyclaceae bacterium]MDZ4216141.1 DUF2339 domain-containing protein [Rhodocyclaceae bacterium]